MAASTNLIGDTTTVINNGPSSVTKANAIAPGGPIQDYPGNCNLSLLKLKETEVLLKVMVTDTDASGDATNLGLINGILAALVGTGGPSSHVLTDIKTVYTNGPQGTTAAKAIAAAGPIMDYVGVSKLVERKLQEVYALNVYIIDDTDTSTDGTNKTLLQNIQLTLS
jgi:hypothetical protein